MGHVVTREIEGVKVSTSPPPQESVTYFIESLFVFDREMKERGGEGRSVQNVKAWMK